MYHNIEDVIVSLYVDSSGSGRVPAALEALRVTGLSTYENRRLSTGCLLLGLPYDPTAPKRTKPEGAPRYGARLAGVKRFHRICDGLNTVFVVDYEGDLTWAVDIHRWSNQAHGDVPIPDLIPCPQPYHAHAKATLAGGHVCMTLTPHQEIKIFSQGAMTFAYSDARWRLLDISTKFERWREAVGTMTRPADLAARLFRAALNLSENRHGALFVVLRDPDSSLEQLVDPSDQVAPSGMEDPEDPDNLSPRLAKQALHHLVRGQSLEDIDASVLESLAQVDGAIVTDLQGSLLAFGAILRIDPTALSRTRAVEGSRTAAAVAASFHGPVLKVSEDGFLTMFLGGRRIWEI